ncbi:hypothetical protein AC578_10179 [Pseudocercospora eumusae]|uniref:Uncharacterized protein n=1 Tax=Pseudocercospora eumusae TaxID=321146 RepID=A0A139HZ85_9PEZI|nr:hypothetical protein AC578_10179 [Pseudocercospora eumusae]
MSELVDYSTSLLELLQALNIIVGHASRTDPDTVIVGRNRRVTLRAFVFSARAATERVLINVQVKNLPFVIARPLTKLVTAFRNSGGARQTLGPFLRLVSIEVTAVVSVAILYRVTRLSSVSLRLGMGEVSNTRHECRRKAPVYGRLSSSWKNLKLLLREARSRGKRDPSLPVVNVGTLANPSYLPLQVCNVRLGQVARAKMIKFAVRPPSTNANSITTVGLSLLRLERS